MKRYPQKAPKEWTDFALTELLRYYHNFDGDRVYQAKTLKVWKENAQHRDSPYWQAYREAVQKLEAK